MRPYSRRELIKKMKVLGFQGPYSGGNHDYLRHPSGHKVHIPNPHGNKDIPGPLIKEICRQMNISPEIFERA